MLVCLHHDEIQETLAYPAVHLDHVFRGDEAHLAPVQFDPGSMHRQYLHTSCVLIYMSLENH